MNNADTTPANDLETERAILGAMLIDPDAAAQAREVLTTDDFYRESHRILYSVMQDCAAMSDLHEVALRHVLEVRGELDRIGGREYIRALVHDCTSAAFVTGHINAVKASSQRRTLVAACKDAIQAAYGHEKVSGIVDALESQLLAMSTDRAIGPVSIRDILPGVLEELKDGTQGARVQTGLYGIDRFTGGFAPGELIVLAARASMGKTSLALNVIQHAADHNRIGVLLFSLEMSKEQIARNLLCLRGKIDSAEMIREMDGNDFGYLTIENVADNMKGLPISIIDSADISTGRVRAAVRRMARKGVGLVVVDYIQLMRGESAKDDLRIQMVKVTRGLKSLAKACNVPVLALSQLTRGAEDREPRLSDLKESGSIEEDADTVLLLSRPSRDSEEAVVHVAKNRNGQTGKAELRFVGKHFAFTSAHAGGGA